MTLPEKVVVPDCFENGASTEKIAAQIEQSLARVCDIIFHLGVLRIPSPRAHESHVQAHVRLAHAPAVGFLSVDLSKDAALLMTRRFKIEVGTPEWEYFVQDVACEVANIIGNNLRTYFYSNGDLYFDIGLAAAGAMPANVRMVLKMEFLLGPTASAIVTFAASDALPLSEMRAESR